MKIIILKILSALCFVMFPPLVMADERQEKVDRLVKLADLVVHWDYVDDPDRVDVGLGEYKEVDGRLRRDKVLMKWSQLPEFFRRQKVKNVIVVRLFSCTISGEEKEKKMSGVLNFLKKCGYAKAFIEEHLMNGTYIYMER